MRNLSYMKKVVWVALACVSLCCVLFKGVCYSQTDTAGSRTPWIMDNEDGDAFNEPSIAADRATFRDLVLKEDYDGLSELADVIIRKHDADRDRYPEYALLCDISSQLYSRGARYPVQMKMVHRALTISLSVMGRPDAPFDFVTAELPDIHDQLMFELYSIPPYKGDAGRDRSEFARASLFVLRRFNSVIPVNYKPFPGGYVLLGGTLRITPNNTAQPSHKVQKYVTPPADLEYMIYVARQRYTAGLISALGAVYANPPGDNSEIEAAMTKYRADVKFQAQVFAEQKKDSPTPVAP